METPIFVRSLYISLSWYFDGDHSNSYDDNFFYIGQLTETNGVLSLFDRLIDWYEMAMTYADRYIETDWERIKKEEKKIK